MITVTNWEAVRLHRICADCAGHSGNLPGVGLVGLDTDPDTGEILEPHFSWGPCDLCHTPDGGNYFQGTLLIKTN
jgi:hypothetical protein